MVYMDNRKRMTILFTSSLSLLAFSIFFERIAAQQDGSLRLSSGLSSYEGRIEIYYSGEWGTVCDDGWDIYDGEVACRQLGYPGVEEVFSSAYFGSGSGSILLDDLQCDGTELSLIDCPHSGLGNHNCFHSEDAGLRCQEGGTSPEGSLRLVGGGSLSEGRVEIYHAGAWGTVCDDNWDMTDGEVACRQLGFPGVHQVHLSAYFGAGEGTIWLDEVDCSGSETRLADCPSNGWGLQDCSHSEDAGITCLGDESSLRLVGGRSLSEGRVEIYHAGAWGTVCDDNWDMKDGDVACRQLGFSGVNQVHLSAYFGAGEGTIWLDEVDCSGSESRLADCPSNGWGLHNCNHAEDAGITCSEGPSPDGSLRLVGGGSSSEGRVEIYHDGAWGTVCDDNWDMKDGEVACRQLGFSGVHQVHSSAYFGAGEGTIWLDEVDCSGSEFRLEDCPSRGWGSHDCSHGEDAGITCLLNDGDIRLVDGPSPLEGRLEIYLDNRWGTICNSGWSYEESEVVCRELGYSGNGFFNAYDRGYSEDTPAIPILLNNVNCGGHEEKLWYCQYSISTDVCSHFEDIGVSCSSGGGLSGGAIAGIVIGSLVGCFILYQCMCGKKKKTASEPQVEAIGNTSGAPPPEEGLDLADLSRDEPSRINNIPQSGGLPDAPPPAYEDIGKYNTAYDVPGLYAPPPPPPPPLSAPSYLPPVDSGFTPSAPFVISYPPPSVSHPPPAVSYPPLAEPYPPSAAPYVQPSAPDRPPSPSSSSLSSSTSSSSASSTSS